jgi:arylsulfatase A-like enzyme
MPSLPRPTALLLAAASWAGCSGKPDGPNILLITLDTTRRDHLGLYGYPIPTSPNLDRLAADSIVYTNAYAVSSWTMPTHASIFTGKFPTAHGANYDPEGPLNLAQGIGERYGLYRARPIARDEVTLAQLLSDHGYETGAVIAGPWLLQRFRLDKGFEHYDDSGVTALNGRPAEDVTRAAIEFLDEHGDDAFFLFLNYYDPHSPWWQEPPTDSNGQLLAPPKPFQDVRPVFPPGVDPSHMDGVTYARICYDAEIRYMDREIGRLLDHLKLRGLYEDTWIFVLADHGELIGDPVLGETGLMGHGDSLTEPEIHIPFLVKEPGPSGRKGEDAVFVQQVDILPTILRRLGLERAANVQGRPLGEEHPIVSELYKLPMMNQSNPEHPKDWRHLGNWLVLIDGPHKYGWSSNGTPYLVDLAQDPEERTNLYESQPELAQRLDQRLHEYLGSLPEPGETGDVEQPTQDELEKLQGLGYGGGEDRKPK